MKIFLTMLLALFLYAADARAQSCVISFTDSFGLSLVDPSQAYGFLAPGGGLIWYYNQCGGSGSDNWLYFDEDPAGGFPGGNGYSHFHIPATDPSINCFTTTAQYPAGVMGHQSSTQVPCVAVNPLSKPRSLLPHHADGVLRIRYLAHTGDPLRYLLPYTIRVIGPTPVKVLFQAANGSWWAWNNLTEGNWNLNGALPARRVFVLSNTPNAGSPWQMADLGITLGDYYTPPSLPLGLCLLCTQDQYKTVRDFISLLTLRPQDDARATAANEVQESEQSLVPDVRNTRRAQSISEQEALRLLARPVRHEDHHERQLAEILAEIPGAEGTARQVLIAEYLLAASTLPRTQQEVAVRRLEALFGRKR